MSLTIGSLFSGIGGLELGLEWAGLGPVKWQVERDAFCCKVLAKHWPGVTRFGEIKTVTENDLEPVDIVCGDFPCQPHSIAGRRAGRSDERWLWPEFARIVRGVRPRFVVLENVPGLLSVDGGAAFGELLGGLAELGYDAWWDLLAAAETGAPHRRNRLFIVAWLADAARCGPRQAGTTRTGRNTAKRSSSTVADANGTREFEPEGRDPNEWHRPENGGRGIVESGLGRNATRLSGGLDGRWPASRDVEQASWEPTRTTSKVQGRQARLKALGNAVVPHCAYTIGCVVQALAMGLP